jgi:alpha-mannosidase
MLNQFHDVIPGTSIRLANEDAWAIYDTRSKQAEQLIGQALETLVRPSDTSAGESEEPITIIDALRLSRSEVIELPDVSLPDKTTNTPAKSYHLIDTDESGVGTVVNPSSQRISPTATCNGDSAVLENAHFRLEINGGRLTSLFDIPLQRELILPGPGADDAGLMLYDDYPLAYDAWDAEIYHLDQCRQLRFTSVEVTASHALRASIAATAVFGKSKVTLTVRLKSSSHANLLTVYSSHWTPYYRERQNGVRYVWM